MVVANTIYDSQYFHQIGYDRDPSHIVDFLSAWPLLLYDRETFVWPSFGGLAAPFFDCHVCHLLSGHWFLLIFCTHCRSLSYAIDQLKCILIDRLTDLLIDWWTNGPICGFISLIHCFIIYRTLITEIFQLYFDCLLHFWIRKWLHIAAHLLIVVVLLLVVETFSKKAYGSVISHRIRMKFGRTVLQVNMHRLTESDFWYADIITRCRPWRHITQKSDAIWWVHGQHLPSTYAAVFSSADPSYIFLVYFLVNFRPHVVWFDLPNHYLSTRY